jgi:hypothetical protein
MCQALILLLKYFNGAFYKEKKIATSKACAKVLTISNKLLQNTVTFLIRTEIKLLFWCLDYHSFPAAFFLN